MLDISENPLVAEIARELLADGRYVMHIEPGELKTGHLQAVVDAGWAARQAGLLLGRPVRVRTSRGEEPGAPLIVTAVLVGDGSGPPRPRRGRRITSDPQE